MEIEFDPVKDGINRAKHGVGLGVATLIFETPSVQWVSLREQHAEVRYVAVGLIDGVEFSCIFAMRGAVARIISVRRARHEEGDRFWKGRRGQIRSVDRDA
jgi:uncharacterized DUF497 family protein